MRTKIQIVFTLTGVWHCQFTAFLNPYNFNTEGGKIISWNVEKVKCDFMIFLATLCNNITLILNVWSSGNRKTVVNIAVGQKWDFLYLFLFMIVEFFWLFFLLIDSIIFLLEKHLKHLKYDDDHCSCVDISDVKDLINGHYRDRAYVCLDSCKYKKSCQYR